MRSADLLVLLPLICPGAAAVLATVAIAVRRRHAIAAALAVAGLSAGVLAVLCLGVRGRSVTPLLDFDGYAAAGMALMLAAAVAVALFAWGYLERIGHRRAEEFYVLLLVASTGAAVLAAATHFTSFFLGIEMLSVSLFAMVAYERGRYLSVEAGVKYLILAAFSSAFLLFGIALVYAHLGALGFREIGRLVAAAGDVPPGALLGLSMVLVGVGFKLAVVPFHQWAPDVYQGGPPPVSAFVAAVSKGAVFVGLLRFFVLLNVSRGSPPAVALSVLAVASMLAGNLLALRQRSVRRILACSSIAHVGYMLVALLAGGATGVAAALFYLLVYSLGTLTAWGVISEMCTGAEGPDALEDLRGLAWRRPGMAAALTLAMLSLAGLPVTAGLIGKFYLASAAVSARLWPLVGALIVGSVIGLYYYLRVVATIFAGAARRGKEAPPEPAKSWPGRLTLAALAVLLVAVGVWPAPALNAIASLVAGLS